MSAKWSLRGAAVLLTVFFLGHTVGGMLGGKSRGVAEDAVLAALRAYRFEVMGVERSHMDFYQGLGWYLSLSLAVVIVLLWQLSRLAIDRPAVTRALLAPFAIFCAGSAVLCATHFFPAPFATSALATLAIAWAWWSLRP
jgi:hypothetical protein